MIEGVNDLVTLLKRTLKPLGFRKTAWNWRLDTPETIVVVNLQKSRWSNAYDLNLGVLVKSVTDAAGRARPFRPSVADCDFRVRLEDLFSERSRSPADILRERSRVHALLNLQDPRISPTRRIQELKTAFDERLLPFLDLCKTEAGIRVAIVDVLGYWYMASAKIRSRLKIPDSLFGSPWGL